MFVQAFNIFRNAFKVPDLRAKLLFTLFMIAIYRVGSFVPVPFIDQAELSQYMEQLMRNSGMFGMVNMFTGGAFSQMTIFALGIMPYISAQIILQLLVIVWPKLEKISKEGEIGRRRLNRYTRFSTIGLTAFQAIGLSLYLIKPEPGISFKLDAVPEWLFMFTTVVAMTTGTAFIMWLGEQITEQGIGNGISIIIMAGIVARYPSEIGTFVSTLLSPEANVNRMWVVIVPALLVLVTLSIVYINEGVRRIPIQQARRVVGRRVMGGVGNVLPLKVNTAGVIPVIFASAILTVPRMLFASAGTSGEGFFAGIANFFAYGSNYNLYNMLGLESGGVFNILKAFNAYFILDMMLIAGFSFFYTAVTFNPLDIADNLKKSGSFIPGLRPGKPTAQFINYVLTRITVIGTLFLVLIAAMPYVMINAFNMPTYLAEFVGGTGLIIVVGVALQTAQQLEAQLTTHNYEGFKTLRRHKRHEVGSADDQRRAAAREATRNVTRRAAIRERRGQTSDAASSQQ